jgi:integrase
MAVKCLKDGRWALYYQLDGKKKWEYFGRGEIARIKAEKRDEQIREERGKLHPALAVTVAQLLNEYHSKHRVEDSTADSDFYRIDRILTPALGRYYAETLNTDQIDSYVKSRLDAGRSPETVKRELGILKSAFNWGESRQPPLIVRNPIAKYRLKAGKQSRSTARINPMPVDDFRRLMSHAPDHLVRAMCLQWYGGQRPGREVLGIRWIDVDFERREILVHSAHKGAAEERYVPIPDELLEMLERWRRQDQKALSGTGTDFQTLPVVHYKFKSIGSLKTTWKHTKERAGITRRLRLYDFRHAWFTNALRHGADLKSTSEVGGHSRADTTMIFYQHTVREQHHEVVRRIPSVAIPPREAK